MKPKIEIHATLETRTEYFNRYGESEVVEVWEINKVTQHSRNGTDWFEADTIAETQCEKVKDIIVEALRKAAEEGRYE